MNVEELLRRLTPQVVAAVARRSGDFAAAEDAVQDALLAAAQQWPRDGLPDNPRGWLIHVAVRRLTDQLRADLARRRRETAITLDPSLAERIVPHPDADVTHEDDTLILLLMCCHPSLGRSAAIALTLRAVGGLTTAEIARAFLVPEATMAQRISRAKQRIKSSGVAFSLPEPAERAERLDAVMHVLYLIFNEGYATSSGPALQRTDLSSEAIRLARALHAMLPHDVEVMGLLALMLLTDARRAARADADGGIVPLDRQDRTLWNRAMIGEGSALVSTAMAQGAAGPFQLQAAIAALHDEAERVELTDWPQILALYTVLERLSGNPMVTLNRAVAVAMVHGPGRGLDLLTVLDADARIAGHYRIDAVRGHFLEMTGDRSGASSCYRAAAAKTASAPERDYLLLQAARLAAGES
jgi:RNA polymerase sigma factor (sigma-70 family)